MRLYFDTTQPNFIKRLPKIARNEALYVICACPITFDENEFRRLFIAGLLLMLLAWAIVKEMSFEERQGSNQSTPIKDIDGLSTSGASVRKRPRMSSPSPTKGKQASTVIQDSQQTSHNNKEGPDQYERSQSGTLDRSVSNTPSPQIAFSKSLTVTGENDALEVLLEVSFFELTYSLTRI
jgi:hypothetical protein